MSSQYINQNKPQYQISGRMKDLVLDGAVDVSGTISGVSEILSNSLTMGGDLNISGNGKITLPALSIYTQLTSTATGVSVSGVDEQFIVETFETSPGVGGDLASGTSVSFQVSHSGVVSNKTMILVSKAVNANTLTNTNAWVTYATDNAFIVTRHNFGATTASGNEKLIFKLIQTA